MTFYSFPCADYCWSAGDVFDGCMSGNARHGPCTYTFFNGLRLECVWNRGHCSEFKDVQRSVLAQFSISSSTLEKIGVGGQAGVRAVVQSFRMAGEFYSIVTRDASCLTVYAAGVSNDVVHKLSVNQASDI